MGHIMKSFLKYRIFLNKCIPWGIQIVTVPTSLIEVNFHLTIAINNQEKR